MHLEKFNTKTQSLEDTKIEDKLSHQIIGASIEVHRALGAPGLLESIYEAALCHELKKIIQFMKHKFLHI